MKRTLNREYYMQIPFRLPEPTNWQDFESLCCDLWKSIWGDPDTKRHGRQGQPQAGVDVYGRPTYSRKLHGVQCKCKSSVRESALTKGEITTEANNAKNFRPELENFIMATTANREVELQEHCRNLTANPTIPFKVSVWGWEDIESEVMAREVLMHKYYDRFVRVTDHLNEYVIDINSTQDRLAAFLTRPVIKKSISDDLLQRIYPLIYELADNAFKHGNAGYVKVIVNTNIIEIHDNGKPFNPKDLLTIEGRGGSATMRFVSDELKNILDITYNHNGTENVTNFVFSASVTQDQLSDKLELTLDNGLSYGRLVAGRKAVVDIREIPPYKNTIIINVVGDMGMGISFAEEYFAGVCKNLQEHQNVVVYLPHYMGGVDYLRDSLKDEKIEFKVRE